LLAIFRQSDIVKNGFDAGIRVSDILAKDMIAIKLLGPVRFVIAAAPKYLKSRERPKHPEELLSHECLLLRFGEALYDRWEFESKGKEFQVQVKPSLIFNDPLLVKDAAVGAGGVIYTAENVIQDEIKSGKNCPYMNVSRFWIYFRT
jgi:DNA-binding transcriptional LysR family regulator